MSKPLPYDELEVGRLYWLDYTATCDNCGHEVRNDHLPAVFVGHYVDRDGRVYHLLEVAFYLMCLGCRGFMGTVTIFDDLPAEQFDLFKGAAAGIGDFEATEER